MILLCDVRVDYSEDSTRTAQFLVPRFPRTVMPGGRICDPRFPECVTGCLLNLVRGVVIVTLDVIPDSHTVYDSRVYAVVPFLHPGVSIKLALVRAVWRERNSVNQNKSAVLYLSGVCFDSGLNVVQRVVKAVMGRQDRHFTNSRTP